MAGEPDCVYFKAGDYAHPLRRFGAFALDVALLFLLLASLGFVVGLVMVPKEIRQQPRSPEVQREINKYMKPAQVPLVAGWFVCGALYYVPLRRTRGGTLGYRLVGIRLVDRTGGIPSLRTLAKRFLLAVPFDLPLGASYLACLQSPRRQAIHDQWSGTWMVRKWARLAGPARTSYQTKLLGTILLTYLDLEPVDSETCIPSVQGAQLPADDDDAQTVPA
jgi:uncharacterized RDD family membrane protein YckC